MLLFNTTMLSTMLILLLPILLTRLAFPHMMVQTLKLASVQSLLPTMMFINMGLKSTTTTMHWTTMGFNLHITFLFDSHAMMFTPTALFITWSIMEFSSWYLSTEPNLLKFMKYLLLFLMAMLTLITANNMLQLFIGWEGVGIMSFLLINWWYARINANTSAMQAIIYNRIGDIGLIISLSWLAMNYNSWDMQQMFLHNNPSLIALLGLVLAATGKSAQFGLHPWLPAAMEGPTPVSALLHSSTMVVAGVFLLIRLYPLMMTSEPALTTCLCLGALTTTFAALCALTQNDIKKIIAFSTSSQLGLMMLTIGMGQPTLAFLHILTHAFFKAMLFLCSGSIIHSLNNEQDIRKMGGTKKTLPITSACFALGSLALAGTPFLAGFYTKDIIIETMNTSTINAWALLITMIATGLTAAYSTRLILHTHTSPPRHQPTPTMNELTPQQTQPLLRLAISSIIMGLLITQMIPPNKPNLMTMSFTTKLLAMVVTAMGLLLALDLARHTTHQTPHHPHTTQTPLTQLYFFNTLFHRQQPQNKLALAQSHSLQSNDLLWYEMLPTWTTTTSTKTAKTMSLLHTGSVKTYLATFTLLTLITITSTIAYGTR